MIEENFKIGVEVEIKQDSLDSAARQVKQRFEKALKEVAGSVSRMSPVPGGPATVRSMRETIKIDSKDFAAEVRKAIATETTSFTRASQEVVKAVNQLTSALARGGKPGVKAAPAGGSLGTGEAAGGEAGRKEALALIGRRVRTLRGLVDAEGATAETTKEIQRLLEKAKRIVLQEQKLKRQDFSNNRKLDKAEGDLISATQKLAAAREEQARQTKQAASRAGGTFVLGASKPIKGSVADQQQGPTNVRIGANIDTRRAAGSQRTAGGGAGKAALLGDAPQQKTGRQAYTSPEEKSPRVSAFESGAKQIVGQASSALSDLRAMIAKSAGGMQLGEDFFKKIGLSGSLKVGSGISATIERVGAGAEHIGKTIKIVDGNLAELSNVLSNRVRELGTSKEGQAQMVGLSRMAARDKGAFEARARALVRQVTEGNVPVAKGQPLAAFQKAGEAQLTVQVTGELRKRLSVLETEAEVISELNKALWEGAQGMGELAGALAKLKKLGVEVATTFGLAEGIATNTDIVREEGEGGRPGAIREITLPVQTRNLADLGLGGAGAMRPARSFQPTQFNNVMGGGVPSVMGGFERQLYQQGALQPGAFKEFKTALVDPNMMPDLFEDQILFDPNIVKMQMKDVKSVIVKNLQEGIAEGSELTDRQTLGTDIAGRGIKFDKTGVSAKVKGVEQIIIDGIEAYKVVIEEINDTITAMKLSERGGSKGEAKAVPGLAQKFGLPEGTAVAMSTSAVARRGDLRVVIEMMANSIAEASGVAAQDVADQIVNAMKEGGKELQVAVKEVAGKHGLAGFTGAETVTEGPLAKAMGGRASIMTGKVAFGRLPNMGQEGPMTIDERFMGAGDIQSLKLMASTAKMAESMTSNLRQLTQDFQELGGVLRSLVGNADEATGAVKGLSVILPEALKRLPRSAVPEEDLKGTLLDPDLREAFAMQVPSREGNKLLRVPNTGVRPGERDRFTNPVGAVGAGSLTKQLDRIAEQSTKVRALRGEVPISQDSDAMREAAFRANEAIQQQIAAIIEMGVETEQGADAARKFIDEFMPLIKMLGSGPVGLQYRQGSEIKDVNVSAEQYVKNLRKGVERSPEQQMFAMRDVLGKRAGTGANIERLGAVFTNLDVLNKVLERFDITLDGTGDAAEEALTRLEKLQEGLVSMLSDAALSRRKPTGFGAASKRSLGHALEGGASLAPIGAAVEFPTDVSKEMAAVAERLREMKAAGQNVDSALEAFERMSTMQKAGGGIPRDAVLINEEDWKNLVGAVSRKYQISEDEAGSRLERPGLLHRYPTTGPRSFMAAKLQRVGEDVLPKGNLGVAGPSAISSPQDLQTMLAPLAQLKSANLEKLRELGGIGPEAERLAADIKVLDDIISATIPSYRAIGLNLDFDGDHILFHGDVAKTAASNLETYSDRVRSSINVLDAFINKLGQSVGKSGMGGVDEFAEYFGQVVKGRPADMKRAVLRPADAGMAGFESHAHIAGKKSVGILTDAFNRMLIAVTSGSKEIGQTMEVFIGNLMLGINKSLAQKHGGGGNAGPNQFLQMFRTGQLDQIREGMESGKDFLGEVGSMNKEMKESLRGQLMVAGTGAGGLDRLKGFFDTEGIGDLMKGELATGNLTSIVDKAVEELDFNKLLGRMFEMMKQNMIRAYTAQGATLEEATGKVAQSLYPKGKTGFVKGIDQRAILEALAPGYAATRKSIAEDLKGLPALERARKVLELLPQQIADAALDEISGPALEVNLDPKEPARALVQSLKSWIEGVRNQVKFVSDEAMTAKFGHKAMGSFSPKQNQVYMRSDKLSQFEESLATLGRIADGVVDPTQMATEELKQLRDSLRGFVETFAHENIHKYAREWQTSLATIIRSLKSASGPLSMSGPNQGAILGFVQRTPNVARSAERAMQVELAHSRGQTEADIPGKAGKGTERLTNITQKTVTRFLDSMYKTIADELLAYQANPEKFAKLMGGDQGKAGVPQEISEFLQKQLNLLAKARPQVLDAALKAGEAVRSGFLDGLLESAANTDPSAVRKVAQERAGAVLDFPGRGSYVKAQEVLGAQERGIMEARQVHKLTPAMRTPTGELGLGELRKIAGGAHPRLAEVANEVKEIQEQIVAGVAPEELTRLHRRMRGLAGKTAAIVGNLTKGGELAGVSPITEMSAIMQDFFATVGQRMTVEARVIQREISEMQKTGNVDTPEFAGLLEKFDRKIMEINAWLEKASVERMGKHGQLAVGGVTTLKGEMLPGFKGLGLDVANVKNFQAAISSMAGEGEEAAKFIGLFGEHIIQAVEAVRQGSSATEQWAKIFAVMSQAPEDMKVNANKLQAIFAALGKIVGTQDQQYAESATNLGEMSKNARKIRDALEGISPADFQEVAAALAGGSKQQRRAFARGAGTDVVSSVGEQQTAAMSAMEGRRKMLEKLVKSPQYQSMGAPRHFEPQQFEIVDPSTGQVLQKLTANFTRFGGTVKAAMEQGGAATKAFGTQMQNALRRVVQWGFATGIIYGTIRAMRGLVDVVVDVQNKVAELQKVMDTSVTNFTEMQDSAVGMAKEFGISIDQVLEGMVVYGQQGLAMNEIMERTRATMMAVNVTTLSADEATEALTATMKIFSKDLTDSGQAVDSWAAVAAKHAVTAKDLAQGIERTGAAAQTAGVGFNDFLGIITAIGSVTRQTGKEVGTAVKFMMRSMRSPTAQKELLGVGIQNQDLAGDLRPAVDVLQDLAGRWQDLSRAQQLSISQAMSGTRHYNQFIVLMENWQEVLDASADAQDSQGFAARKNAIVMETVGKQMQRLRETVKSFALDLGKVMLPAMTGTIKVLQMFVNALEYVPDVFKQAGVAAAVGGVAFHKVADIISDTTDAIFGTRVGKSIEDVGIFGALSKLGKKGMGGFAGMGKAFTTPDVRGVTSLAGAMGIGHTIEEMGVLSRSVYNARTAISAFVGGLKGVRLALASTGIGALIVVLGALAVAWSRTQKSGQEVEDGLFDIIGRTQDSINKLQMQSKSIDKVSLLWNKYASAVRSASKMDKLQESVQGGNFKGPQTALKEYKDAVFDVGMALASIDPSSIEGIGASGEFAFTASDGMKALIGSAVDAKKAMEAAMQTKIIKAYTDEITKAKGFWANFVEVISFGTKDMDLLSQLKDAREELNKIAQERQQLSERGILDTQNNMNSAVEKELELRGEILTSAENAMRVLKQMPTFSDSEMARSMIGTKGMKGALGTIATSGAAGREATAGSLAMQYMGRNLGLGGMMGAESTANPLRSMEGMLAQGMHFGQGAKKAGEMGFVGADVAKSLLQITQGAEALANVKDPRDVLERARTVLTGVDSMTGEMIFYFEDAIGQTVGAVKESEMGDELKQAMKNMLTVNRGEFEAAAERTRKLLTIQSVGALAGIRIPKEGMPDIGPGMSREFTTEQRVMMGLPDEMERMAEVQAELAEISKRYNEGLGEVTDDTEVAAHTLKDNVRVLNPAMKELVKTLQLENFDLSVLAHMQTALGKLSQTLESSAVASRDAAIEEKTRLELIKHTAGALKGLPVTQQVEFGKGVRELSAQERLQKELGPGFSKTLAQVGRAQSEVERRSGVVTDIRKQAADFEEMLADLDTAGKRLTSEQEASMQSKLAGITKGDQMVMDVISKSAESQLTELQRQTPLLDRMLESLNTLVKVEAATTPEEKKKVLGEGLNKIKAGELMKILGAGGQKQLETFARDIIGLRSSGETEKNFMGGNFYSRGASKVQFGQGGGQSQFDAIASQIESLYEKKAGLQYVNRLAGGPTGMPGEQDAQFEQINSQITAATEELLAIPEVADAARSLATKIADREAATHEEMAAVESQNRRQQLISRIAQKRAEVYSKLEQAQQQEISELARSADALSRSGAHFMMAEAAMGFATAVEATIDEFKKAEMLFYDKVGSDIDGAFARVGRPGFKTDFDIRRDEIKERSGGFRSLDQMRTDTTERKKIGFDEKEAVIKEAQDKEVAALRVQQAQAEKMRDLIADQLMAGQLSPETSSMAKSYMDTLTDQLSESEQASMQGNELYFQGVPALDDARNFLQKLTESAKEEAQKAQREFQLGIQKEANQPIVDQQKTTNAILSEIRDRSAANQVTGATSEGFIPGGAAPLNVPSALRNLSSGSGLVLPQSMTQARGAAGPLSGERMNWMSALSATSRPFEMTGPLSVPTSRTGPMSGEHLGTFGGTKYYRGDASQTAGSFVREQSFASRSGVGGPLSDAERLKTLMELESKSPATKGFTPTGLFKGGTGPLSFTNRPDAGFSSLAARQTGASNYNQVLEASNSLRLGNRDFTTGAVATDARSGRTPGSQVDRLATGQESPGTKDQAESLSSLSEQMSTLIEAVNALASTPDQGSTQIVEAITQGNSALADLLGGTLAVEIGNSPLVVSVDGLDQSLASAFGSSGLSGIGAQIADANLRLQVLEGVVDPNGPSIEDRITAVTDTLQANLDTAGAGLADLEIEVEGISVRVDSLESLEGLDLRVNTLETDLGTLTATVETQGTTLEALQTSSIGAVAELQDSLLALGTRVEQNKQDLDTQIREQAAVVARLDTTLTQGLADLQTVRGKTETALSQAQTALNQARQPR